MSEPPQPPIVNIEGERVALGPISKDLLPVITRWMADFGAQQRLGFAPEPFTLEKEEEWYAAASIRRGEITFLIRERATMAPIGTCSLFDIDYRNGAAVFGIMIGEAAARGKGNGTETARLMLDYAFTILGLHSVSLEVAGFNLAGQKAYARAGFKECGRLRERRWIAGRRYDQVYMDCLATEFTGSVLADRFRPD
jgi:RimJ/RimL family protein N-acetyltransferase